MKTIPATILLGAQIAIGTVHAATTVNWTGAGGLEAEGTDINSGNTYVLSDGNTVTPSVVFTDANGDAANFRIWHNDAHGGAIRMDMDLTATHTLDSEELRMNFGTAVTGLTFHLEDIDQGTWDDNVVVTYNLNMNAFQNSSVWSYASGTPSIIGNQAGDGWEGNSGSSNQDFGTIDFDFGNIAVSDVSIRFGSANNPDLGSNPATQHIHVSDFEYLATVPEPSSLALVFLSVLSLGISRRRQDSCDVDPEIVTSG